MKFCSISFILIAVAIFVADASAQQRDGRILKPDATVDLRTTEGVESVRGKWRYSDAKIIEVDHRSVGLDLKPSGRANRTNDISPKAGAFDFDDSAWPVVKPENLESRRSNGRLSFAWYRINITIPEKIGSFATRGSTAFFEIVVDDYAEVWVNGKLPQVLGQSGGAVIKGWNAPNRLVIGRDVKPGDSIQIAVFAANGPLSKPPENFIWIRSATLDFYHPERIHPAQTVATEIERLSPELDAVVPSNARIEKLAEGFGFTEGPVWANSPEGGYLLFSDPNNNTIYRYESDGQVSVFRSHSGYTGANIAEYGQPGSNGLTIDPQGRLTICEHGNRRITRLEKNGVITVLADRVDGRRLNSPNDLIYRSDGTLYFTDPPFGLPKFFEDPRKELSFSGVYSWKDGMLKVVCKDLAGPNGLAFSPDERYLYVDNWDPARKVVMRYEVASDGRLSNGIVFYDLTSVAGEQAFDGLKVDRRGNVYVSGPGGVLILNPMGKHIGTIRGPEQPANFAWGDDDFRSLYLTARTGLYRIRLNIPGASAATVVAGK